MPINDYLFDRLKSSLGNVEVINEGEPATYGLPQRKVGYDGSSAYPVVESWGEGYKANCPFCGDQRGRLFFCHLAGARVLVPGKKRPLQFSDYVCVCHNEHCNSEDPAFKTWIKELRLHDGPVLDLTKAGSPKKANGYSFLFTTEEDTLPEPCYPLTSAKVPAYVTQYLESRGFDPYELQAEYGCGFSPNNSMFRLMSNEEYKRRKEAAPDLDIKETQHLWGDRIIVPVVQGRRLVGWQGRTPYTPEKGKEPKYYTSPALEKSKVLFNLDRAILGNVVVVVEGVFDVFRIGAPAVCLFGKVASPTQIMIMKTVFSQTGGCLVMLDPDAPDATYKLAEHLFRENVFPRGVIPVYLPPGPDPAECTASQMRDLIEQFSAQLTPLQHGAPPAHSVKDLLQGLDALDEVSDE